MSIKPSPRNEEELKKNVENHMLMLQMSQDRVKKYFEHDEVQYAAS